VVFQHVGFEGLGSFEAVISDAGYGIETIRAPTYRGAGPTLERGDLLVVLGGPVGANEESDFPFLSVEIDCIRRALDADARVLGICLGAQLLARALGAAVRPARVKEIGYAPLTLTDAGHASPLRALDGVPVLHWHGDTFDIPDGGRLLASTQDCQNQAFAVGEQALGLQFHAEADSDDIGRWIVGHIVELRAAGVDLSRLRADAARHGTSLIRAARELLGDWLAAGR